MVFKFVFLFVQPSKITANNPKVKIIPHFLMPHTSSRYYYMIQNEYNE